MCGSPRILESLINLSPPILRHNHDTCALEDGGDDDGDDDDDDCSSVRV